MKELERLDYRSSMVLNERLETVDGSIDALMYSEQYDSIWAPDIETKISQYVETLVNSKYPSSKDLALC